MAGLNPNETFWFRNREDQAQRQFRYGQKQNAYERELSRTQGQWDREDLIRQFTQQRQQLPQGYTQRGLMNSGVYQRGLGEWGSNKLRSLGRQSAAQGMKMQGYDIADVQLTDIRNKALDDLRNQRIAYEQTLASILRGNL